MAATTTITTVEEAELAKEAQDLKEKIRRARAECADTRYDKATGDVVLLFELKFRTRRTLKGHLAKVYALNWCSANHRLLASVAQDGKIICWDTHDGTPENFFTLKTNWLMACGYSPSGALVASGGLDNLLTVFRTETEDDEKKAFREMTGHEGYVACCRFIDDNQIVTCSGDQTCAIWDIEKAKIVTQFCGHTNDVNHLALAADRRIFVSASCDRTCRVWDVREKNERQVLEGHDQDANGVSLFPQNEYAFASSSDDCTCRLWDLRSDQEVAVFIDDNISAPSTCVAFSRSGRLLFAGYDDYKCYAWDTLVQERIGILQGHDNRVSCIGVPESGVAVCTGSWDSMMKIWTSSK